MSGLGVGINYAGENINMSVVYSKGIESPRYLQSMEGLEKEEEAIYWKIGASW
jgi:hypothetical protein